ncbi:MAG: hypothetical protein ACT4P0_03510 [Panacagrimonas sp.]
MSGATAGGATRCHHASAWNERTVPEASVGINAGISTEFVRRDQRR